VDDVKVTLRNFRAKIDDKLSWLRSSNAKFRFSFNIFSDGGNFSAEEIDVYKKKLEKMALLIDTSETNMLKEMEKLEKRHLDDAIKALGQFQDKFKYNLVDLQFIEKISRWLNEAQIKIKINVNESNARAKELNAKLAEFELKLDACRNPTLDKLEVKSSDLVHLFDELNKLVYERAFYLKCILSEQTVPMRYHQMSFHPTDELTKSTTVHQGNLASSVSLSNRSNATIAAVSTVNVAQQPNQAKQTQITIPTLTTTTKLANEDPALTIIKNILRY
jgi:hypothetical protein